LLLHSVSDFHTSLPSLTVRRIGCEVSDEYVRPVLCSKDRNVSLLNLNLISCCLLFCHKYAANIQLIFDFVLTNQHFLIKKVIFLSFLRPISTFFSNFATFFERNISFLTTPSQIQSSPQVSSSPILRILFKTFLDAFLIIIYSTCAILQLFTSAKLVFFSNHHHFMPFFYYSMHFSCQFKTFHPHLTQKTTANLNPSKP